MPIIKALPRLHVFALSIILILLVLQTVMRLIFWVRFNPAIDPMSSADLLWSFYLGFKFDLRIAVYAVLPIMLLGWIKVLHPVHSAIGRKIWMIYASVVDRKSVV